jgi:hypothetical protein
VSLEGLNPKPPPPGFTDSRVIISFRGKFRVHTSCGGGSLNFVITAGSRYLKTKKKIKETLWVLWYLGKIGIKEPSVPNHQIS